MALAARSRDSSQVRCIPWFSLSVFKADGGCSKLRRDRRAGSRACDASSAVPSLHPRRTRPLFGRRRCAWTPRPPAHSRPARRTGFRVAHRAPSTTTVDAYERGRAAQATRVPLPCLATARVYAGRLLQSLQSSRYRRRRLVPAVPRPSSGARGAGS